MAHHQHHGSHAAMHALTTSPTMPAISEDEVIAEADEPPDHRRQQFTKTRPTTATRRQSLLTQSLQSESESHNETDDQHFVARQPSRSSTCSTMSDRSHPFTSDDGPVSPSTRASTPGTPPRAVFFPKRMGKDKSSDSTPVAHSRSPCRMTKPATTANHSDSSEPVVEAGLGRKRCITFACGKKPAQPAPVECNKAEEPSKRPCTIKFACPTKWSCKKLDKESAPQHLNRRHSPAPGRNSKPNSPSVSRRSHRDSDTTIKNDSPKSVRKSPMHIRRPSNDPDMGRSEATRFHEFASSDEEEAEDWTKERTVHKTRLTVGDTLKKETEIRHLHEDAEEEALEEEEEEDLEMSDEDEDEDLSELSDEGFQTDDECGFAQSDDDDDDDSDYEWWVPRGRSRGRSPAPALMLPLPNLGRPLSRDVSRASDRSASSNVSPGPPIKRSAKKTSPVKIRPSSPELPDSTDFVCGTLDEDRPLEQAYMNSIVQRKAAKHRPTPQDIDPTFPTSDPEANTDEEDEADDVLESIAEESEAREWSYIDQVGGFENLHGDPAPRRSSPKRLKSPAPLKRVTSNRMHSPKRLKSPAPAPLSRTTSHKKASPRRKPSPAPVPSARGRSPAPKRGRSPAPKALFDTTSRRVLSPRMDSRPPSPPPSRRGSLAPSPDFHPVPFGTAFLGHRPQLTHTSSLPRSGHGFNHRISSIPAKHKDRKRTPAARKTDAIHEEEEDEEDEDDASTAREDNDMPYTRGAIDIVQGLERKRLRRRQKFMEKYQRKEDKKRARGEAKRPKPGQGAQRMRQIGIDCAVYRGKRVLSV